MLLLRLVRMFASRSEFTMFRNILIQLLTLDRVFSQYFFWGGDMVGTPRVLPQVIASLAAGIENFPEGLRTCISR